MLALLMLGILVAYVARLMEIQIVEANTYKNMLDRSGPSSQVIKAARGEIVDRGGRPLTTNRMSYDVIFDKAFLPAEEQNDIILRLMLLFEELGEKWDDDLPITAAEPFHVIGDGDARMDKLRGFLGLATYASAEDAMYWLIERYGLQGYSPAQQRKIAGVRYEMEQRGFALNVTYTFATDIDITSVLRIKDRSYELAGVDVIESTIRTYADGTVAPHIVGTIGPIYTEEYDELKELGYAMDDVVGKEGAERAFESYLRGENGVRKIYLDFDGEVSHAEESQSPVPGNTVFLSLDIDYQRLAQEALKTQIENLQQTARPGEGREADAGAVVMLDVKTGQVLAAATYPSYDLTTYRQDYAQLVQDTELTPLVNRALNGEYAPGSTFKPTVALTGLSAGLIDESYRVTCNRVYPWGYRPTCLSAHGSINVVYALCRSCNIFFYDTGRRAGIELVDDMARQLGLGEPTGIEISESIGSRSNPEVKMQLTGEQWYSGDVLQSSIGQLYHQYTPLQLANYAATIANRGQRMKVTIVSEIRDYSMQDVVVPASPQVLGRVEASREAFEIVVRGMVDASGPRGTASATFGYYPITVASKTGTPETYALPNSTFICFAPAEDPQIAIAVVIEKGYHGYTGAPVAKALFDEYFGFTDHSAAEPETSAPEAGREQAGEPLRNGSAEGSESSMNSSET